MKAVKQPNAPIGASLITLASLIYASYGVWMTLMGNYFGNFTQAVLRASIVGFLLLLIASARKQTIKVRWKQDSKWLLVLLVSSLLIPAPMYYAVLHIGVGLSMGIGYASVILGAFFLGWLVSSERYTKDKWLATALGLAGLWLIFIRTTSSTFEILPMIAALASGFGSALDIVALQKLKYSTLQSAGISWIAVVITNLPFILIFKEHVPMFELNIHWLWFLIFVLASLSASWLYTGGLKLIEAGAVGILGLLEVVFAVLLGVVIFNEHLQPAQLFGILSIMIAATIPYATHYQARSKGLTVK